MKPKFAQSLFSALVLPISLFAQSKKLTIGDTLPEIRNETTINYRNPIIQSTDFKNKYLVLTIWGTWADNYADIFTKTRKVQESFKSKIQFLPVTTEAYGLVSTSLGKNKNPYIQNLFSVVEDTSLSRLFNYRLVPHYVWINDQNIIKAITGPEALTESNLTAFINNRSIAASTKTDKASTANLDNPILTNQEKQTAAKEQAYSSALINYSQELLMNGKIGKRFIRCTNLPVVEIIKLGFGEFTTEFLKNGSIILEGFNNLSDSLEIGTYNPKDAYIWARFRQKYSYCFEISFQDSSLSKHDKFKLMQKELNRHLAVKGVFVKKELRNIKLWTLTRIASIENLKSSGGQPETLQDNSHLIMKNVPLSSFIARLSYPTEDMTNILGNVDIKTTSNLTDLIVLNKDLEKYGLKIEESIKEVSAIVIKKMSNTLSDTLSLTN